MECDFLWGGHRPWLNLTRHPNKCLKLNSPGRLAGSYSFCNIYSQDPSKLSEAIFTWQKERTIMHIPTRGHHPLRADKPLW
ncbi:hypothetical protein CC2G_009503 [Coprinopsis cinerea AmutBmut pab1-1]|nr:hypothetical protein CC2G_004874 [Coprinopsis cinerea AmutBmut pab1-1]KAG2016327.1 hypothetical protein CC2G_009503 [Coprinopsis cinerea AmutBmut pab1-1]